MSFDQEFASAADWACAYRALRLNVIPASAKKHPVARWGEFQDNLTPDAVFARWYGDEGEHRTSYSMGFLTGSGCLEPGLSLLVIDVDAKEKDGRETWAQWLQVHANGLEPDTWKARTGSGGRHIYFSYPSHLHIHNTQVKFHGIDTRAQGGFIMAPPSPHQIRGTSYEWEPGCNPLVDDVDLAPAPDWLIEIAQDIGSADSPTAPRGERVEATTSTDPWGNRTDGREAYMRDMVWAAVVDLRRANPVQPDRDTSLAKMQETYEHYARRVRTRFPGEANEIGLEREGRGLSLFQVKWDVAMRQWNTKVAAAALVPRPLDAAAVNINEPEQPVVPLDIIDWGDIDEGAIPPRPWIVPAFLLRRNVTVLVAPPGSGKSLFGLQIAMACAANAPFGNMTPRGATRTLIINAEDDIDEASRRRVAAQRVMGLQAADMTGRLLIARDPDDIRIVKIDQRTGMVAQLPLADQIERLILDRQIDVLVVDPFVETFDGNENDNMAVNRAAGMWRGIARRTSCAVLLIHHTRKYASGMAGDADVGRGASALGGVARIVNTMFTMSAEEADSMGVPAEERTRYVRLDDAKANQTLLSGSATWFEKVSVTLANGGAVVPGDSVGALRLWTPPGPLAGVSMQAITAVLDAITRGVVGDDGRPTGQFYSPRKQATTRWAGRLISEVAGVEEGVAGAILGVWLKSGLLVEADFHDGKQARKGLRVDASKRPA